MPQMSHLKKFLDCFDQQAMIEAWFAKQLARLTVPLMLSVDIRYATYKIAEVDANIFPAGFNNLAPDSTTVCVSAIKNAVHTYFGDCQRLLLISESHTRNVGYYQNLAALRDLLTKAGYQVLVGSLLEEMQRPHTIELPEGASLTLHPIRREGHTLMVKEIKPCAVILNHDLLEGVPPILINVDQPIAPPLTMSWSFRLKSTHFEKYDEIVNDFSRLVHCDPWLLKPLYRKVDAIDFIERTGEEELLDQASQLWKAIHQKYREHDIPDDPFLVVKADAGTYGMGVLMVNSVDELRQLNRKQRTRMSATKGSRKINKVIVQEGIYTSETVGDQVAEPVIYMAGQKVVGGFYRTHANRGTRENLNTKGMEFTPIPYQEPEDPILAKQHYAYRVIARLACLATAREAQDLL